MVVKISIHVPREGNDALRLAPGRSLPYFNPRSVKPAHILGVVDISIHVPREGNDPSLTV